jgi:hypothetical protein
MHIHIHHHYDDRDILTKLELIMSAIDDLSTAVAQEDTVIQSAITLINGIPALIAAAGVDPVKLATLQADIQSHANALATAVTTNTPVATNPAPGG